MTASEGLFSACEPTFTTSVAGIATLPRHNLLVARNPGEDTAAPHLAEVGSCIRAVYFDVEDVLYDTSQWYRWLAQVFTRLDERAAHDEFLTLWKQDGLSAVYTGHKSYCDAFADCLLQVGFVRRQIEELVAAERAQRRCVKHGLRVLPGVRSTLHRLLAAGFTLGVLTNIDRSSVELQNDLGRLGLAGLFTVVITSLDLQACLPDANCFGVAVESVGRSPHEILFVGHEVDELKGAHNFGVSTLAFNAQDLPDGIPWIDRFDDLLEYTVSHKPTGTLLAGVT